MKRKKENKKKSKRLVMSLGIILFILIVVLIIVISQKDKENVDIQSTEAVSEEQEDNLMENPDIIYQTEAVEIYTLFPSSIINTDAKSEFIENLACVEFKNISGNYLKKCEIQIKTEEGDTYSFLAEDIPAEMEVMAFEISNKTLKEECAVTDFVCSTEVDMTDVLLSEQLEISENGTEVTIKNISGKDLSDLVVTCHCVMENVSYGGLKYEYPLEILRAGETATINATDCYFGQAKVVRVVAN